VGNPLDLQRILSHRHRRQALAQHGNDRGLGLGAPLEAQQRLRLTEADQPSRMQPHQHIVLVLDQCAGQPHRHPVRHADRDDVDAIDLHERFLSAVGMSRPLRAHHARTLPH
jgi:hypothetical protein